MSSIRSSKHIFIAAVATAAIMAAQPAAAQNRPAYLANFPNFEPKLTPGLPGDVDTAMQKDLEEKQEFAKVQRLFDLWSWQAFVSLNWPTDDQATHLPTPRIVPRRRPPGRCGRNSTDIFLPRRRGADKCAASQPPNSPFLWTRNTAVPVVPGLQPFTLAADFDKRKTRLLGNISAVGELNPD